MQKQIQWAILIFCLSGIFACNAPSDVSNASQKQNKAKQQRTHIYTGQFKALEKSKNLANDLNQAELARQQQIEEATR